MTKYRFRRNAALFSAVLLVAAGGAVLGAPSARSQPASFLGWTAKADANAVDVVIDNASGLSGFHPVSEADIPEATSDYETGPFGHGLASVAWPGGTLGNLGSLSGALGLPPPLATVASKANDPVRAETYYPFGPENSSYPSGSNSGVAEMTAHADAGGVTATAALSDLTVSRLIDVSGVKGASTAAADSLARASATGSFSSLSVLGGLITVGASSSTATAQSDGSNPNGTAATHIGAITIAGHAVSVGTDGLVIGPAASNLPGQLAAPVTGVVQSLISALGLTMTALPQVTTRQGAAETVTSAGLQIKMSLPSTETTSLDCSVLPSSLAQLAVLCTLPGLLQGANVTLTIGRVTSSAIAAVPFGLTGGLPSPGTTPAATAPSGATAPASATSTGVGTALSPTGAAPAVAQPPQSNVPSSNSQVASPPTTPISLSTPLRSGLVVAVLLLAALIGAGAIWGRRRLENLPAAGTCDLEGSGA